MSAFDAADVEAFETVEPVFQAAVARLGGAAFDPAALGEQPAAVRRAARGSVAAPPGRA